MSASRRAGSSSFAERHCLRATLLRLLCHPTPAVLNNRFVSRMKRVSAACEMPGRSVFQRRQIASLCRRGKLGLRAVAAM